MCLRALHQSQAFLNEAMTHLMPVKLNHPLKRWDSDGMLIMIPLVGHCTNLGGKRLNSGANIVWFNCAVQPVSEWGKECTNHEFSPKYFEVSGVIGWLKPWIRGIWIDTTLLILWEVNAILKMVVSINNNNWKYTTLRLEWDYKSEMCCNKSETGNNKTNQ